mmetsp:Transcript_44748/g.83513  ORF Transcript_44748/g.83513 Transcript_44748/m.83513 type:complete len:307 (-) Transcript_44748:25-945(-)
MFACGSRRLAQALLAKARDPCVRQSAETQIAPTFVSSARHMSSLFQSSSAKTFKQSRANKEGLSYALDGTLRDGSHDMKVFGLGYLRSVASNSAYIHFATSMYFWYKAMEENFDTLAANDSNAAMAKVWTEFPELRRAPALKADLAHMGLQPEQLEMSPATAEYVRAIHRAGERSGDALIGHFYCRYFADLFGGSMLGYPTRVAMRLTEKPAFYCFSDVVESDRKAYIESVYRKINEVGALLPQETQKMVVEEAKAAFRHNAAVYSEVLPRALPSMHAGAAIGAARIVTGAAWDVVSSQPKKSSAL